MPARWRSPIYGGYFGAGMGVLMIVLFLITANIGVQQSAGLRMWCATGVNTLAVAAFIAKGIVAWRVAIPMLICTLIGGYWGAHAVQQLDCGDGAARGSGVRLDHEPVAAGAVMALNFALSFTPPLHSTPGIRLELLIVAIGHVQLLAEIMQVKQAGAGPDADVRREPDLLVYADLVEIQDGFRRQALPSPVRMKWDRSLPPRP